MILKLLSNGLLAYGVRTSSDGEVYIYRFAPETVLFIIFNILLISSLCIDVYAWEKDKIRLNKIMSYVVMVFGGFLMLGEIFAGPSPVKGWFWCKAAVFLGGMFVLYCGMCTFRFKNKKENVLSKMLPYIFYSFIIIETMFFILARDKSFWYEKYLVIIVFLASVFTIGLGIYKLKSTKHKNTS